MSFNKAASAAFFGEFYEANYCKAVSPDITK